MSSRTATQQGQAHGAALSRDPRGTAAAGNPQNGTAALPRATRGNVVSSAGGKQRGGFGFPLLGASRSPARKLLAVPLPRWHEDGMHALLLARGSERGR